MHERKKAETDRGSLSVEDIGMEAISDLKAIRQICAAVMGEYFEAQLEAEAKHSQPGRDMGMYIEYSSTEV